MSETTSLPDQNDATGYAPSGGDSFAAGDGQGGAYAVSQLYSFGDRLADTGNTAALQQSLGQPASLTMPPYSSTGSFSDGLNWTTILAQSLGIHPSEGQTNFAYESATARALDNPFDPNQSETTLTDFAGQIDQFRQSVGGFLPDDLVTVTFGDYDLTLPGDVPPDVGVSLSVEAITAGLHHLADLGAQHFLVANLRFVTLSPAFANPAAPPDSDEFFRGLYNQFNAELSAGLDDFRASTGLDVRELDLFSLFNSIAGDPSSFGFANVAEPLLVNGPVPGTTPIYNPAIDGQDPAVQHATLFLNPFYDVTAPGQAIMAQTARDVLAS